MHVIVIICIAISLIALLVSGISIQLVISAALIAAIAHMLNKPKKSKYTRKILHKYPMHISKTIIPRNRYIVTGGTTMTPDEITTRLADSRYSVQFADNTKFKKVLNRFKGYGYNQPDMRYTYPIVITDIWESIANQFISTLDKSIALYYGMTYDALFTRLITRPSLMFNGYDDYHITANKSKQVCTHNIGLIAEDNTLGNTTLKKNTRIHEHLTKPDYIEYVVNHNNDQSYELLSITDTLLYPEMQLAKLICISSYTKFVNTGVYGNNGVTGLHGPYEEDGILVGLVGERFEADGYLSWKTLIKNDNTDEFSKLFNKCINNFYDKQDNDIYADCKYYKTPETSIPKITIAGIDGTLFIKSLMINVHMLLDDAIRRPTQEKFKNRIPYVVACGLGSGVWAHPDICGDDTELLNLYAWISCICHEKYNEIPLIEYRHHDISETIHTRLSAAIKEINTVNGTANSYASSRGIGRRCNITTVENKNNCHIWKLTITNRHEDLCCMERYFIYREYTGNEWGFARSVKDIYNKTAEYPAERKCYEQYMDTHGKSALLISMFARGPNSYVVNDFWDTKPQSVASSIVDCSDIAITMNPDINKESFCYECLNGAVLNANIHPPRTYKVPLPYHKPMQTMRNEFITNKNNSDREGFESGMHSVNYNKLINTISTLDDDVCADGVCADGDVPVESPSTMPTISPDKSRYLKHMDKNKVHIETKKRWKGYNLPGEQDKYLRRAYIIYPDDFKPILERFIEIKQKENVVFYNGFTADMLLTRFIHDRSLVFYNDNDRHITRPAGFSGTDYTPSKGHYPALKDLSSNRIHALLDDMAAMNAICNDAKYKLIFTGDAYEHICKVMSLENTLTYPEMLLSAFTGLSAHTKFINSGSKGNLGNRGDKGTYEEDGIFMGLVGARLEAPGIMDYTTLCGTTYKNNIYECNNVVDLVRYYLNNIKINIIFANILTSIFNPAICEKTNINNILFVKRLMVPAKMLLDDACRRMQYTEFKDRKAYVVANGLGDGVWAPKNHKPSASFINVCAWLALVFNTEYDNIPIVEYRKWNNGYVDDINDNISAIFDMICKNDKNIKYTVKNANVHVLSYTVGYTDRYFIYRYSQYTCAEPFSNIRNLTDGAKDCYNNAYGDIKPLLVTMFAWDSNSYVGNEFWDGMLAGSMDPAAACCSDITISMNPEINTQYLTAEYANGIKIPNIGQDEIIGPSATDQTEKAQAQAQISNEQARQEQSKQDIADRVAKAQARIAQEAQAKKEQEQAQAQISNEQARQEQSKQDIADRVAKAQARIAQEAQAKKEQEQAQAKLAQEAQVKKANAILEAKAKEQAHAQEAQAKIAQTKLAQAQAQAKEQAQAQVKKEQEQAQEQAQAKLAQTQVTKAQGTLLSPHAKAPECCLIL